jgi:hypothetical protein
MQSHEFEYLKDAFKSIADGGAPELDNRFALHDQVDYLTREYLDRFLTETFVVHNVLIQKQSRDWVVNATGISAGRLKAIVDKAQRSRGVEGFQIALSTDAIAKAVILTDFERNYMAPDFHLVKCHMDSFKVLSTVLGQEIRLIDVALTYLQPYVWASVIISGNDDRTYYGVGMMTPTGAIYARESIGQGNKIKEPMIFRQRNVRSLHLKRFKRMLTEELLPYAIPGEVLVPRESFQYKDMNQFKEKIKTVPTPHPQRIQGPEFTSPKPGEQTYTVTAISQLRKKIFTELHKK